MWKSYAYHLIIVFIDCITHPADITCFPPYFTAHLFFHRFQHMKMGVACNSNLCAGFFAFVVHQAWSCCCSEWPFWSIPVVPANLYQTLASCSPEMKLCWMLSIPALSIQQKHFDGSMPNLVSLSLVGSLPLRVLQKIKEVLKGICLFHNKELECCHG